MLPQKFSAATTSKRPPARASRGAPTRPQAAATPRSAAPRFDRCNGDRAARVHDRASLTTIEIESHKRRGLIVPAVLIARRTGPPRRPHMDSKTLHTRREASRRALRRRRHAPPACSSRSSPPSSPSWRSPAPARPAPRRPRAAARRRTARAATAPSRRTPQAKAGACAHRSSRQHAGADPHVPRHRAAAARRPVPGPVRQPAGVLRADAARSSAPAGRP